LQHVSLGYQYCHGISAKACIIGAQIKMKVEQSREDKILAQKRQKLLAFLNSSVE